MFSHRASKQDDQVQRFIDVVRYYLSGWHIKPKVKMSRLCWGIAFLLQNGTRQPFKFFFPEFHRVWKSHTIQFWVNFIDANTTMLITQKATMLLNKCRTTRQSQLIIMPAQKTALLSPVISAPRANSWAIAPLPWCKARLILYSHKDIMKDTILLCLTCMLVEYVSTTWISTGATIRWLLLTPPYASN